MYSIRLNVETQMIEILKDTYVEYEVAYKDWKVFTEVVVTAYYHPGVLRKVRNIKVIPGTSGPAFG